VSGRVKWTIKKRPQSLGGASFSYHSLRSDYFFFFAGAFFAAFFAAFLVAFFIESILPKRKFAISIDRSVIHI
jgi:hypothetical protein